MWNCMCDFRRRAALSLGAASSLSPVRACVLPAGFPFPQPGHGDCREQGCLLLALALFAGDRFLVSEKAK